MAWNSEVAKLALLMAAKGPEKVMPTPKRIRLLLGGRFIADSLEALAVWEHWRYPQYYLPKAAFQPQYISMGDSIQSETGHAIANMLTIEVDGKQRTKAFEVLQGKLKGYVKVYFDEMSTFFMTELTSDAWFEEDTQIFVHPKDPFKRIDTVQSRRPIRVTVRGRVVAESDFSVHLYETSLPARYYIPLTAIDQSVLRPSDTISLCPYKGRAEYHSIVVEGDEEKDLAWYYSNPCIESAAIAGLICFWNEKVDIEIDGKKLDTPVTHFFA